MLVKIKDGVHVRAANVIKVFVTDNNPKIGKDDPMPRVKVRVEDDDGYENQTTYVIRTETLDEAHQLADELAERVNGASDTVKFERPMMFDPSALISKNPEEL